MSAFVVNREHIDALVRLAFDGPKGAFWHYSKGWTFWHYFEGGKEIDETDRDGFAHDIGRILWLENVKSVAYRYPNSTPAGRPGPSSDNIDLEAETYTYTPGRSLTVAEALMAIACYEYQSCEHPEWKDSKAKGFCEHLRAAVCRYVDGYDQADTWNITTRTGEK